MNRATRTFFVFLGCLCLINACGRTPQTPAQITILVPRSLSSLPLISLAKKSPFHNIVVKIEYFSQHAQAIIRLLRGDADMLFTGTTQGWQSYWDGSHIVVLQSYVWGVSSLLVKTNGPSSIAGLKGKKIAVPFPNSPLDAKTRFFLTRAGNIPGTDVFLEYRPFAQSIPLFLEGRIDAIALPEPLASDLVRNSSAVTLINYRSEWGEAFLDDGLSPEVSLFTTLGKTSALADLLPVLHAGIAQELGAIMADPAGFAERFYNVLEFPEEVIAEAIPKTSFWACDFTEHKQRMMVYYYRIRDYFTQPAGALDDRFFFDPLIFPLPESK